jgi:hypothetical protein
MTNYTGHSCINKKKRHGKEDFSFYCGLTGKPIDPMVCNKDCKQFETVAEQHKKPPKK